MHRTLHRLFRHLLPVSLCLTAQLGAAASPDDKATLAALDLEFQAAVKRNDLAVVDRILADGFVLISGGGVVTSREALITAVRERTYEYEVQDEVPGTQSVRVWGDTGVVTALLWLKGRQGTTPFNRKVWFSDVYVRTAAGWRYAHGQVGRMVEKDGQPLN